MAAILETRMGSHVGSFFLPKYKNVHYPTKTNKVQRKIIDIEKLNFLTTIYCGYLTKTTRKFRSMKMCTPHDKPTHMLENPEQYITRVGRFLRGHSLDELPQIWDIFIGNMSVIGPRPGLWNQDLLTAERDKYGANDVRPGLTGWAQINGRDELEIPEKAKLDGFYCEKLSCGMELKCFLGSVGVFGGDDSVVEGGTGEMAKKVMKR